MIALLALIRLRNFNGIYRKDVTYDNIKSHKKPGGHPFSEKHTFEKTAGGGGQIDPHPF